MAHTDTVNRFFARQHGWINKTVSEGILWFPLLPFAAGLAITDKINSEIPMILGGIAVVVLAPVTLPATFLMLACAAITKLLLYIGQGVANLGARVVDACNSSTASKTNYMDC